jgi:integrase
MPNPPTKLNYGGRSQSVDEWAAEFGIPASTLRSRVFQQGWDVARALTTPVQTKFSRRKLRAAPNAPRPCPRMKRHHTGQAYSRWKSGGRENNIYFGKWGSKEAAAAYRRFQQEWLQRQTSGPEPDTVGGWFVGDLATQYLAHARTYYRKDGRLTSEIYLIKAAIERLTQLFGETRCADYTTKRHKTLVDSMVAEGLSRGTINDYAARIVRMFGWGVAEHEVPPDVHLRLKQVPALESGRTTAPDPEPKRSVPEADIQAVLPYLHSRDVPRAVFVAMIQLQLVSGMRPGEVCAMRVGDLQRGQWWKYEPRAANKNRHKAKPRVIWLGPRAQGILAPLLAGLGPDDYVFSYPRRGGRKRIDVPYYRIRVEKACVAAGVDHWHPHRLRHNYATSVSRRYEDDEAVRVAIGDTAEVARQVYVDDPAEGVAKRIAKEMG